MLDAAAKAVQDDTGLGLRVVPVDGAKFQVVAGPPGESGAMSAPLGYHETWHFLMGVWTGARLKPTLKTERARRAQDLADAMERRGQKNDDNG